MSFAGDEVTMQAKKRFGQNFLQDPLVLQQIIAALHLQPTDHVLEIGPGQAALTSLLQPQVAALDVVEIDRDLIQFLQDKFAATQVKIHAADILQFNLAQIKPDSCSQSSVYRVVGNLPYNISTPLLFHLFSQQQLIQDVHVMLQREVVQRLAAQVGDKHYGRLSVMCQYYCEVEPLFEVPPQAFKPEPQVMSGFVRLTPHKEKPYAVADIDMFSQVVREAFSHRRKTLANALKKYITPELRQLIHTHALDLSLRPQQWSGELYAKFASLL